MIGLIMYQNNCHGNTRGVSHCDLAIYIKKYVKAKEYF
jgi:hypothetical protein